MILMIFMILRNSRLLYLHSMYINVHQKNLPPCSSKKLRAGLRLPVTELDFNANENGVDDHLQGGPPTSYKWSYNLISKVITPVTHL